ncbi:hypothetical protein NQP46_17510 [Streptomyces albus]|nr:hypothetical protein NQP46_17510 [Streptomyces albus]
MRYLFRTAPALVAAAFTAGLLVAVPAQAAPAADGLSDVNGDGYGDLVTASEATVAGSTEPVPSSSTPAPPTAYRPHGPRSSRRTPPGCPARPRRETGSARPSPPPT